MVLQSSSFVLIWFCIVLRFCLLLLLLLFDEQIREPLLAAAGPTSFPGFFLSREKDLGWVWSRANYILGGNKENNRTCDNVLTKTENFPLNTRLNKNKNQS